MGTVVYNFVGETSPAGATGSKGLFGGAVAVPAPNTGTEGTQQDYDDVESYNQVYWDETVSAPNRPYKQFRFNPTKAAGLEWLKFTGSASGYQQIVGAASSYAISIWNYNSASWELLDVDTPADSETTVGGSRWAHLSNYVEADFIWLATYGTAVSGPQPSILYDDYISLTVITGVLTADSRPDKRKGAAATDSMKWVGGTFNPGWNA